MKHSDAHTAPFRAPALAPLAAHLGNMLATRQKPWKIRLGDTEATLCPVPDLVPFSPACTLRLRCGESLWQIGLGSLDILRAHPALAEVPEGTPLPMELRQAVLELLAEPIISSLSTFLGLPLRLEDSQFESLALHAPHDPGLARLMFELCLPRPRSSAESPLRIPLALDVPNAEGAHMLLARLNSLPQQNTLGSGSAWASVLHSLPVPVSVEAGRMMLRQEELSALALEDILLPDEYPAARGVLTLRFLSGEADTAHGTGPLESPSHLPSILCSVDSLTVTVTAFLDPLLQESLMSTADTTLQTQNSASSPPDSPQHSAQSVDTGALELVVSFELERRLMSVQDISALSPGYTFAMGSDALSPVTMRVNGKAVGTGRLVDVQGVLGIQITALGA